MHILLIILVLDSVVKFREYERYLWDSVDPLTWIEDIFMTQNHLIHSTFCIKLIEWQNYTFSQSLSVKLLVQK